MVCPALTAMAGGFANIPFMPIDSSSTGQENLKAAVKSYLEAREPIIIFDCCEHLVEEVASLAEELFVDIPGLRILATSREALRAVWPFC
jgi:hypothetical protein